MAVVVEPYNPDWPLHFEGIRTDLESYLEGVPFLSIEHVGSTSVPGLAAKPIIDVDIIVTRENIQGVIDGLVNKGNCTYLGEMGVVDRHALKSRNQSPPRNIYICVEGAFQLRNHLGLRDTLRKNSALRDEYGSVKLALAAKGIDIVDYLEGKSAVIQKIQKEAGLLNAEELAAIEHANKKRERFSSMKTERLMLREFVMGDVPAFHALESNEEVVRYQTFAPRSEDQAHKEVATIVVNSCAVPRTHIELAVLHHEKFIGRVSASIKKKDDDGKELDIPHANLWFSFVPELHGNGFATEAMHALIGLLKRPLTLEIECDPRHIRSAKMAERLGFEKISLTEEAYESKGEWVGSLVYQRTV